MNTTCSSGSRWSLVWVKKSANFWAFIPPITAEWKASSWTNGECDSQISSSLPTDLPVCSFSSYRSALASNCPYVVTTFIDENCVAYAIAGYEPVGVVMMFCITSGRFRSAGWRLANLKRNSIPSRVLATVRSWILGFRGRRRRSSWSFSDSTFTYIRCYDTSSTWPVYTNGICYRQINFVRIFKCRDNPFSLLKKNTISTINHKTRVTPVCCGNLSEITAFYILWGIKVHNA